MNVYNIFTSTQTWLLLGNFILNDCITYIFLIAIQVTYLFIALSVLSWRGLFSFPGLLFVSAFPYYSLLKQSELSVCVYIVDNIILSTRTTWWHREFQACIHAFHQWPTTGIARISGVVPSGSQSQSQANGDVIWFICFARSKFIVVWCSLVAVTAGHKQGYLWDYGFVLREIAISPSVSGTSI